jgi:hypothetical protein
MSGLARPFHRRFGLASQNHLRRIREIGHHLPTWRALELAKKAIELDGGFASTAKLTFRGQRMASTPVPHAARRCAQDANARGRDLKRRMPRSRTRVG